MNESEVRQMILGGERPTVEFKSVVPDSRVIARLLAAFANGEGGTLLIGIGEDGRILGADVRSLASKVSDVLPLLRPEPRTAVEQVEVGGASIGIVTVEASREPPVLAEGAAFARIGPTIRPMTSEDLRPLMRSVIRTKTCG